MSKRLCFVVCFFAIVLVILTLSFSREVFANSGEVMWSSNGKAICDASSWQTEPVLIPDGNGGTIIAWRDYRNGSTTDIYAQRIDANSNALWTASGVVICTASGTQQYPEIASDGNGGAIIVWQDKRNGTTTDIYAQKIDASGNVQWTSNGVAICTASGDQSNHKIISDGAGGAIITWDDKRGGIIPVVYAQRIDSSGSVLWTSNGVGICTVAGYHFYPQLVSDGSNGAIITWRDYRGANNDVYAQRVDADGNLLWTNGGVVICNAAGDQLYPKLVSDNNGGAIITWHDRRVVADDVYAQRVDADGAVQWTSNGVAVCAQSGSQTNPQIIQDGSNGAIIVWEDNRNGATYDLYVQRINSSGNLQWAAAGVAVCTAGSDQTYPELVSDGMNGSIITWQDKRNGATEDVYTQRISSGGTAQWTSNGVAVCTESGMQVYPQIISDGSNGAIITWYDYRPGTSDIYAQRVEGTRVWYLAEGCTSGFDEYVLIENPNSSSVTCDVTFMQDDGTTSVISNKQVGATTRSTIRVNDYVQDKPLSVKVESTNGVGLIVERAMYWPMQYPATEPVNVNNWTGGHNSCGVTQTATTWYLAEGCTNGFDEWISIQNPNSSSAACNVTFMKTDSTTVIKSITVVANGRATIWVNDEVPNADISTKVESINNLGIIAERAMYWPMKYGTGVTEWMGGHNSTGVAQPNVIWYLAEGCTDGFDEYISIQNPNSSAATCQITFMRSDGTTVVFDQTIGDTTRATIRVNEHVQNDSLSTKIESTNGVGVIAERMMYWPMQYPAAGDPANWTGGHGACGVTSTATKWYLAEGCTNGFDEYISIQNPNSSTATCQVTFLKSDGTTTVITRDVGSTSRSTIRVNDYLQDSVSTVVESTNSVGIIVERVMYWPMQYPATEPVDVNNWREGHCSKGVIY